MQKTFHLWRHTFSVFDQSQGRPGAAQTRLGSQTENSGWQSFRSTAQKGGGSPQKTVREFSIPHGETPFVTSGNHPYVLMLFLARNTSIGVRNQRSNKSSLKKSYNTGVKICSNTENKYTKNSPISPKNRGMFIAKFPPFCVFLARVKGRGASQGECPDEKETSFGRTEITTATRERQHKKVSGNFHGIFHEI